MTYEKPLTSEASPLSALSDGIETCNVDSTGGCLKMMKYYIRYVKYEICYHFSPTVNNSVATMSTPLATAFTITKYVA